MSVAKDNVSNSELSHKEISIAEALGMGGGESIDFEPSRLGAKPEVSEVRAVTTISSREINQDLARAKRAAVKGPVIITDRGRPAFVLTTFEEYERTHLKRSRLTASEALAMDTDEDIELELPERVPHVPSIEFD